jgi:hypothetical protein
MGSRDFSMDTFLEAAICFELEFAVSLKTVLLELPFEWMRPPHAPQLAPFLLQKSWLESQSVGLE